MSLEIEGKWLIGEFDTNVSEHFEKIEQGYIAQDDRGIVRVRRIGDTTVMTVKGRQVDGAKPEVEFAITEDTFSQLWPMTNGRIEKTRYYVDMDYELMGKSVQLTVEVDVFGGDLKGFVMAEIEVGSREELITLRQNPPTWFGRDVTDDMRYSNSQLAKVGLPEVA